MAVLPILRWPDVRLRQRCAEVEAVTDDVRALVADLFDTMYEAKGRGLAAPQVGAMQRLFVMDAGWKEGRPSPVVLINPDILWMSDERAEGPEGCLSIPGISTMIARATEIRLRWTDLQGQRAEADLSGFPAICAQHEFDHLDGIVTFNRLPPHARALAEAQFEALKFV